MTAPTAQMKYAAPSDSIDGLQLNVMPAAPSSPGSPSLENSAAGWQSIVLPCHVFQGQWLKNGDYNNMAK